MKKNLVHEEFKVLQEKKEYYKQRKMTAYFERLNMIKKEYGKYSPEAINMEQKYIEKYGDEDGLTMEGWGNYQKVTEGCGNNKDDTEGCKNNKEDTENVSDL